MKALIIPKPGTAEVREMEPPVPDPREVCIEVAACGVCGTDIHIYKGEYLGEYPIAPGHEFSGTVTAIGEGVTRFRPGDRVAVEPNIACGNCPECLSNRQNFCRNWTAVGVTEPGGMAEYVKAPEPNVFAIGDLSFEAAAFVEPLSCVLHGIRKVGIDFADRVAVLGAGPIGQLIIRSLRARGVSFIAAAERSRSRAELARASGADLVEHDPDRLEREGFDVVVDATGVVAVMERTVDFVRPGGRILLFGVPPKDAVMRIEPFRLFRYGLTVVSSYTSRRNSFMALNMLDSGRVRVDDLISHRFALSDFPAAVELIESGADDVRKVLLVP
jgi:D-arabinitol dehydrogenase (NADP+)